MLYVFFGLIYVLMMATPYSLQIFSTVLALAVAILSYAKEEERQVYIVYMGGLPQGETKYSLSSYHVDMLQQVTSNSFPGQSLVRSYTRSFNAFAANLTQLEREKLATRPLKDENISEAEFAYGTGHIDPVKAVSPGLVYDISTHDHIKHLCDLGYNASTVRKITGDNSGCLRASKVKTKHDELNYPSMAAKVNNSGKAFRMKFFRTVTNVGHAKSRYEGKIVNDSDSRVVVRPRVLKFGALDQRKSFVVIVGGKISQRMISASIEWSDGRHKVRSPIVVYDHSALY